MFISIYNQFLVGLKQTTILEFIAVLAGITSVWLSKKENILVYPIGLINTILYTFLCFNNWKLYAEGSLNFYYTIMSLIGWYNWNKKTNGDILKISKNSKRDWIVCCCFWVFSFLILIFFLKNFTDSNVPLVDALASALAFTAMFQMTNKKIEHWYWWIATNTISIPLYFYKQAVFSSFQYLIFLIIAIAGLTEWKNKFHQKSSL